MAGRRTRLARARKTAGYTQERLADALHVDISTVKRWETAGSYPQPYLWPKLARLLNLSAAKLGELLDENQEPGHRSPDTAIQGRTAGATPGDMAPDVAELGLVYGRSLPATVETVATLGRSDMERRQFLTGAMFAVAASVAPSRDWLVATLGEATQARGKVGAAQVDVIRRTFGVFQELDVMRGGGHARTQLAAYLNQVVVPLLRTNDPETESGQALYGAASEQLYLLGWMAFDNGEHAIAQRYLIQALRLADAAKSVELGAHVLAGLSDQATLNGHPDHGAQLARTGVAGLQRGNSPACLADLRALQARAEAAMGELDAAVCSVGRSQEAFARVTPETEPEWARFIDVAYLNGEYAHAFRDLEQPSETARFAELSANEAARQQRARRGSLANAAMARAALSDHDLDAAASAGLKALQLASTVRSSRSTGAVKDLHGRLLYHKSSPHVAEFLEQSDTLMLTLS